MKNHAAIYHELRKLMKDLGAAIPQTMESFGKLHESACSSGNLSAKSKELIALGISIASRCDGCISYHTHDAIVAGASKEEIAETIGVAVMMGGGPSVVYGCEALHAYQQFTEGELAAQS